MYIAMTKTVLLFIIVEEERTEILKSGLDLAVQCRNLAKTEVVYSPIYCVLFMYHLFM